ncbi:MAG TPA: ion channel [Alphaproteobacteria bacterium]|nr:ion channel [Alphaproteobacteria bacterium]
MSRHQRALHRKAVRVGPLDVTKVGVSRFDLRDPYHLAVTATWPVFTIGVLVLYAAINILFATLYAAVPGSIGNARPGSIFDAFFFSMETLATVGYGQMYPATTYGHLISVAEIMSGLAFTTITTGLIFVRFSKPRAKILYADHVVITPYNGLPTLMVRIGNGRMSILTDLNVRLSALISERSSEGHNLRRVNDLRLVRSNVPMFALMMTLMHPIDEHSPLYGHTSQSMLDGDVRLFLSVQAQDSAINSTVHDLKDYRAHHVKFGMKYTDAVTVNAEGRTMADLTLISVLEPDGVEGLLEVARNARG